MNQCLTKKAVSSWIVKAAEGVLMAVGCFWIGMMVFTAVYTCAIGQFKLSLAIGLLIFVLPAILLLCWIANRRQRRIDARLIACVLCMTEQHVVSMEQLAQITGINNLELVLAKLLYKGYIRNVTVARSEVRLEQIEETTTM